MDVEVGIVADEVRLMEKEELELGSIGSKGMEEDEGVVFWAIILSNMKFDCFSSCFRDPQQMRLCKKTRVVDWRRSGEERERHSSGI